MSSAAERSGCRRGNKTHAKVGQSGSRSDLLRTTLAIHFMNDNFRPFAHIEDSHPVEISHFRDSWRASEAVRGAMAERNSMNTTTESARSRNFSLVGRAQDALNKEGQISNDSGDSRSAEEKNERGHCHQSEPYIASK